MGGSGPGLGWSGAFLGHFGPKIGQNGPKMAQKCLPLVEKLRAKMTPPKNDPKTPFKTPMEAWGAEFGVKILEAETYVKWPFLGLFGLILAFALTVLQKDYQGDKWTL